MSFTKLSNKKIKKFLNSLIETKTKYLYNKRVFCRTQTSIDDDGFL